MDDAYCGGGDTNEGITSTAIPISAAAQKQIKAAIFMGDPRYIAGLSYEVGTCAAQGVRPVAYFFRKYLSNTARSIVCPAPRRLRVPVREQHPVVLRRCGPVLLQRW